jgi:hypothetical protein
VIAAEHTEKITTKFIIFQKTKPQLRKHTVKGTPLNYTGSYKQNKIYLYLQQQG